MPTAPNGAIMSKALGRAFTILRAPEKGGGGGAAPIPNEPVSVSGLMSGEGDGESSTADQSVVEDESSSEPQQRRAQGDKKKDDPEDGGDENDETVPNGKDESKKEDETKEPSNDDYKSLHSQAKESNKRLRADNDKLRTENASLTEKATLLDNINGMLNDPERKGEGLKIILETAAKAYDGDIIKALAGAGFEAKPAAPPNPLADKKDAIKERLKEKIAQREWDHEKGEGELVHNTLSDLVDLIVDELGPAVAQSGNVQRGSQAQVPAQQAGPSSDDFHAQFKSAMETIREQVPLFEISEAEGMAAKAAYPSLDLEDAIRLKYGEKLFGEKSKQDAGTKVKTMVSSNGRVKGGSVLDPDRVAAGPISLGEAFDSFKDF